MKRKTKNSIMITLVVVLLAILVATMYLSGKSIDNKTMNPQIQENGKNNAPDNNNFQSPPDKPDGNGNGENQNGNNDGSIGEQNENNSSSDEKQNNSMPPSDNNNGGEKNNNSQNMNPANGENQNFSPSSSSTNVKPIFKIALVVESLVLTLLLTYLILSNFNKKTFKETFSNKDKTTIFVLSTLLFTLIFSLSSLWITNHFFLSKGTNNREQEQQDQNITYQASKEITTNTTLESGNFSSSKSDENVLLITGEISTTLSNLSVSKSGDASDGDSSNFYGNNSAILAKDKANVTLNNIEVTTTANGANGVFSYGGSATTNNASSDGTTVTISNSKITTTKDNAGGIMTTGGGIMNAKNLTIKTAGTSSAAIRSDRGGGTVTVEKGTYETTGAGSPAIYSTADIKVKDATLLSKASEGIVIEGKNSVEIEGCTLEDNNTKLNGKSTTYKNIFIYQSMSGDAQEGNATFTAKNSQISTKKGDTLYVTNTKATITLENNMLQNTDTSSNFLRVQKDSWGQSGSNGGEVTLNLKNQSAKGKITVDSLSTLTMSLTSSSYYEGAINTDNGAKEINLTLDKTSKIKLTADSYVSSFTNKDQTMSNIDFNGYKLYVGNQAIN